MIREKIAEVFIEIRPINAPREEEDRNWNGIQFPKFDIDSRYEGCFVNYTDVVTQNGAVMSKQTSALYVKEKENDKNLMKFYFADVLDTMAFQTGFLFTHKQTVEDNIAFLKKYVIEIITENITSFKAGCYEVEFVVKS